MRRRTPSQSSCRFADAPSRPGRPRALIVGARRPATRCLLLLPILVGALLAPSAANSQNAPAPGAPDFKLSASPDSITVHRGETGRITIKVEPLSGLKGRVDLLSSLLYATSTTLSPEAIENGSGTAVLSISPSAEAIKGSYTVSITGTYDGVAHSITVMVTVK